MSTNSNYEILVIGAGAWGIALAEQMAKKTKVMVWDKNQELIDFLQKNHTHPLFPHQNLNPNLHFSKKLIKQENVLLAVSSAGFLDVLNLKSWQDANQSIAIATKGILLNEPYFLPKIITEENTNSHPVMISGPSFAKEVMDSKPTGITVASTKSSEAKKWAKFLHSDLFRPYLSNDPLGVSIFGALKNIYAIVCGISAGLDYGANTNALLISRSLAEMTNFAQHFGADKKTSLSLAGVGDLILTSSDDLSRNRSFGVLIGKGYEFEQAQKKLGKLVEGLSSLMPVIELAKKNSIAMPIAFSLYEVLYNQKTVQNAIHHLFSRDLKKE